VISHRSASLRSGVPGAALVVRRCPKFAPPATGLPSDRAEKIVLEARESGFLHNRTLRTGWRRAGSGRYAGFRHLFVTGSAERQWRQQRLMTPTLLEP
jgi:hypothetical protein